MRKRLKQCCFSIMLIVYFSLIRLLIQIVSVVLISKSKMG